MVFRMEQLTTSQGIARVISQRLEAADISQRSVSADTGIALTTLSRRLAGKSPFGIDELEAIAALLGTTISDLVAEAEGVAA